jgi:hypothetical protein
VEKPTIAGDNPPDPVGCPWTTSCTGCGSSRCPQSVEIVRPRIHNRLTWSDGLSTGLPVETIWTTPQSPACGEEKVAESVESGRNAAANRTADDGRAPPPTRGGHLRGAGQGSSEVPVRTSPAAEYALPGRRVRLPIAAGTPRPDCRCASPRSRACSFDACADIGARVPRGGRWRVRAASAGAEGRLARPHPEKDATPGRTPPREGRHPKGAPSQNEGALTREGRPGITSRDALEASRAYRGGQPALMRLVSSVTWL